MKHLAAGDSFVLQTSDRRNLSNQFSTKKHLKQAKKRLTDNADDASQSLSNVDGNPQGKDTKSSSRNMGFKKRNASAESSDFVLSSQKIVLKQQEASKKYAGAPRPIREARKPPGFVRADLGPL